MTCPACGSPVPEGSRFCPSCGRELQPVRDQRRVVTVVFGDLVGFTSLSERLDPEHVKNLVDRCFDRLAADVRDFGGEVDKIVGDGIVALFGATTAHEDDAERAVRAALKMQRTLAEVAENVEHDLQMRIGVNTGEALVGAMRAAGTTTAMGDVVNTASRLQTAASPGEVLVGPATHAATEAVIEYESRGEVGAKGKEAPVVAWRALEPKLPPGRRPRRVDVPVIGREHELFLLHHALETSFTHHRALFTLLVGDPGLGKTRIAEELAAWAAEDHDAVILHGRCVPYGEANVWWPIAEAVRHGCGVSPGDPEADAQAATVLRVAAAFDRRDDDSEVVRVTNGLLFLMGYGEQSEVAPASAHDEAVRSLVAYIDAATASRPLLLQLSDVHWADDRVLELLDDLFERLHHRPAAVIATARPQITERWAPKPGRHNNLVLNVDPLDRESSEELLEALTGSLPPPSMVEVLLDRSGGNPFFLEELVSLVGSRADEERPVLDRRAVARVDELPDTLRGLVSARLDALESDALAVLQDAAVIGRTGPIEGLREMESHFARADRFDELLANLVTEEILVIDRSMWRFRSDLVREVAYQTITKIDRAHRHAGIADYIERKKYPDHLSEPALVDQLAHHYGLAVELANELGVLSRMPSELPARALHWITTAAEQARESEMLPTAIRLYGQALDLLDDGPSAARLQLLRGRAAAYTESWHLVEAREDAERAVVLADELRDDEARTRAVVQLGVILQREGEPDEARDVLREAANRFAELENIAGRADALRQLGMVELFCGRLDEADAAVREAQAGFVEIGNRTGEAWCQQNLAWIAFITGRTEVAAVEIENSIGTFAKIGDNRGLAWALGLLSYVRFQQGNAEEAESLAEQILRESRTRGDRWAVGMMLMLLGMVRLWSGRTDDAVAHFTEARDEFGDVGDSYGLTMSGVNLGRALAMVGRIDDGLTQIAEARDPSARGTGIGPVEEPAQIVTLATAAVGVQIGDPTLVKETLHDLPWDEERDGGADAPPERRVALALAAMQEGNVAEARARLGPDPDDDVAGRVPPSDLAARALLGALEGSGSVARLAERVVATGRSTYLDRAFADLAAALAAARGDHPTQATARLTAAMRALQPTGDRLGSAVLLLAADSIRARLGEGYAGGPSGDARTRLDAMGIRADGWTRLFDLAAGVTRVS